MSRIIPFFALSLSFEYAVSRVPIICILFYTYKLSDFPGALQACQGFRSSCERDSIYVLHCTAEKKTYGIHRREDSVQIHS